MKPVMNRDISGNIVPGNVFCPPPLPRNSGSVNSARRGGIVLNNTLVTFPKFHGKPSLSLSLSLSDDEQKCPVAAC